MKRKHDARGKTPEAQGKVAVATPGRSQEWFKENFPRPAITKMTKVERRKALDFLIRLSETGPRRVGFARTAWRRGESGCGPIPIRANSGDDVPAPVPARSQPTITAQIRDEPEVLRPPILKTKELLSAAADGKAITFAVPKNAQLRFDGRCGTRSPIPEITETCSSGGSTKRERVSFSRSTFPMVRFRTNGRSSCSTRCASWIPWKVDGAPMRPRRLRSIFLAKRPKQVACGPYCRSAITWARFKERIPTTRNGKLKAHRKRASDANRRKGKGDEQTTRHERG